MAGEEWARRVVQKELGQEVVLHDDNSSPGMYDLRVGSPISPSLAIECVGAVDSMYVETWNVGPAKGPLLLQLRGDWAVEIAAEARLKTIRQHIESILQYLEIRGVRSLDVNFRLRRTDVALHAQLESLRIRHVSCLRSDGSGKVHFTMPGTGGTVDENGSKVAAWLEAFVRDPARADVISKLQQSMAKTAEVFVIATLGGTPWEVESYLTGEIDNLPLESPVLPEPVAGIWLAHLLSSKGLHWNGVVWKVVPTKGEGIEGPPPNKRVQPTSGVA